MICYLLIWVRYLPKIVKFFKLTDDIIVVFEYVFLKRMRYYTTFMLQGLGLRPGVIDGAVSISAVQVFF